LTLLNGTDRFRIEHDRQGFRQRGVGADEGFDGVHEMFAHQPCHRLVFAIDPKLLVLVVGLLQQFTDARADFGRVNSGNHMEVS
jgi:hypothetical protein